MKYYILFFNLTLFFFNQQLYSFDLGNIPVNNEPTNSNLIREGEKITFSTPDGKTASAYFLGSKQETNDWLFITHEWWGITNQVLSEAEHLHNELENVNVIVLDFYDGIVAHTPERAAQLMTTFTNERGNAIIEGAKDWVGTKARVATFGKSFGGEWALRAATILENQSVGSVVFYGLPQESTFDTKQLNSEVLGIFASKETLTDPIAVNHFKRKMDYADKELSIHIFNAYHDFTNPSSKHYDLIMAEEANTLALSFLKNKLSVFN